jgi:hypothetical protein
MPIFGEVGLNNQGRIAEKSDRKVCIFYNHLNFSAFSLLVTGFRVQRLTVVVDRHRIGMTDRGAEETSEGAVEDIANQKIFKLAPKQYKIKKQVTLC